MQSLKNQHFLKLLDLTPAEITYLLDLAAELKAKKKAGIPHRLWAGWPGQAGPGGHCVFR